MSHFGRLFVTSKAARLNRWREIFKGQRKASSSSFMNQQEYQTMEDVKRYLFKRTQKAGNVEKYLPKSQKDLPVRKMKESFASAVIPLSVDENLRNKYTTVQGNVRTGKLMEDLDFIAVYISDKHILYPQLPPDEGRVFYLATISIATEFKSTFKTISDIRISGHVTWVGTSSLEVFIWMDQLIDGKWLRIMKAMVLMTARNVSVRGPAIVNSVEGETEAEKAIIRSGEERRKTRLLTKKQSLLTTVPSMEEFSLIHTLFLQTVKPDSVFLHERILPPNSRWMHEASASVSLLCHPEFKNLHNKIFGGFLIRQATELAWITASKYKFYIPALVHISDITFYHPVDLGCLLMMEASITFTDKHHIQVSVVAVTQDIREKMSATTSFNFTFFSDQPVDQIYPLTYLDAMKYIDGRRQFLHKSVPLPDVI